ncbi:MAG TPA: high frequency lysogenization protein HflD [Octadecabacter sp.]|nr:high frequency lysogenization protein HflD [Octadecabacter sp.]
MFSFLTLGLVVGMAHALEADHLAAVGALASGPNRSSRRMAWLGASWGLGHTTTLLLISLPLLLLGMVLSARVASGFEFAVGVMLVALGVGVLRKLRRARVHFHLHSHGDGERHFHAHSHQAAKEPHARDDHDHDHTPLFSFRSYFVGLAHGVAGSAGLVAMAAAATQDVATTLAYIAVFGLGSTVGMAGLTLAASWPLRRAEQAARRMLGGAQIALASVAILVGVGIMFETGPIAWGVS